MLPAGVDPAMFDAPKEVPLGGAFDMQALDAGTFDAAIDGAGGALAVVFFWGVDCFNCEIAKKAMLAQPDAIRALNLKWFHCNVYEHHELGRRFGLHGVPTWFFFHRGKRLGRATGWHGLAQFQAAVSAARAKIAVATGNPAGGDPLAGGD
ncbi:thioredoxin family protein [Burkholderia lata]|uniref:Thioredoxin n=1 Tax=Burkholderia lata (strain ATCC 17760 / DSM 23089 / LMG 22485 / NCIMB 9086 / R18194 / 383) TaxID=482957 RepID=A0A6P2YTV7_BURL3|nr:thioredoxin family protein [Burkholderia lata]VWD25661.1 thioredoxin [Burkholderia lata]